MSPVARKGLYVILALLVLVGGGAVYLATQLDAIVAGQIEKHGSAATQTDVRVRGVNIELREARAGLNGLTVANPEGFDRGQAIELGEFSVKIDPSSLTGDTIVLNEVVVNSARLNLLQLGSESNFKALLDNLRGDAPREESTDDGSGKTVVIERFVLDDARATVSIPELDENREVTVPRIVLTDIGRASGGATAAQAARQILEPIIERTMRSAAAQAVKDRAQEELDKAKDSVLQGVMDRLGGDDDDGAEQQD